MTATNLMIHAIVKIKIRDIHSLKVNGKFTSFARSIILTDINRNEFHIDMFSKDKNSLDLTFPKKFIKLENEYPLVNSEIEH